jgi:hypothetical protein
MFVDRDYPYPFVLEKGLISNGIHPTSGKAVEFPDQDYLKRRTVDFRESDHLTKGWTSGISSAFGFCHLKTNSISGINIAV